MAGEAVLGCRVCGMSFRSFPLCSNGCCLVCHAMYCHPSSHTLDLEKARAERQARGIFMMSHPAAAKPHKPHRP